MKSLIVANWKMNPQTLAEAKELFSAIEKGISGTKNADVVICPPFLYIPKIQDIRYGIHVGAQNCFWEDNGAYTGEVSPQQLKDLGVEYVIIGHSERRDHFGEKDEAINKKIKSAIKVGLKPILCVGETAQERELGKTNEVLARQLEQDLRDSTCGIVAYEPVWAIGSGMACGVEDAKAAKLFLKTKLKDSLFLYGGSVDSENAKNYIIGAGLDGLLVGGASLNPEEFVKIIVNSTT